jgi:hypothetical protein
MSTFKVMRDVDPLTRRPSGYRYEASDIEAIACHFDTEARREDDMAGHCAPAIARQHRGAAKAWRQAAIILRATTLVPSGLEEVVSVMRNDASK